ncbi:ATP-binding protein [Sphingobium sp. D43FB]|uniref:ATP-binding protein n=1 Tax=Sphingobium sp. D43FB TaxID=2017595 RepID=UPI000BB53CFC|nr:ATP-binding protein [Sphingobium sp. D43FB]PBN42249.1 AAA family ATPase [Sphingobium sp. D43FB]
MALFQSDMLPRHSTQRILEALQDTRVVLLAGPRQAGKTTLARSLSEKGRTYLTLDDATTLSAARADPAGLVRDLDQAIIDEVQRAPDLLLAIKESVDRDPRPGRFLLTGSANLMTLPRIADSLAGRMEIIRLLPLAQSEILAQPPPRFLASLFASRTPVSGTLRIGGDLVDLVLAGGYPEAIGRKSWLRRQDWYENYVDAIVERDVRDVANIDQLERMPRLLRALAVHSGQLVNHAGVGASLGLNHVTTQKYTAIFEQLFLVRSLPPWHNNALKRLIKKPKLHFLDSGLLAALRGITPEKLAADRSHFGAILETFVYSEVLKATHWSDDRFSLSHFRDKELDEVDIVIENRAGQVVGLEIKAAATVRAGDFAGLRKLAAATGDRFAFGAVLYDHNQAIGFGDNLAALPLSCLWG